MLEQMLVLELDFLRGRKAWNRDIGRYIID